MTPQDRKNHGASLRQARRRRVHDIRRRVLASATALFVAVWMLIAVMLVTGHDPALATKRSTAVASTQASTSAHSGTGATVTTGASGTTATTAVAAKTTTAGSANTGTSSGSTTSGTSSLTSSQS